VSVSWLVLVDRQLKCYWLKIKRCKSSSPSAVTGLHSVKKIPRQDKVYKNYNAHLLEKVRRATVTSAIDTTDLSDIDQERRSKVAVKIKKSGHGTKTLEPRMPAAPPYQPVA